VVSELCWRPAPRASCSVTPIAASLMFAPAPALLLHAAVRLRVDTAGRAEVCGFVAHGRRVVSTTCLRLRHPIVHAQQRNARPPSRRPQRRMRPSTDESLHTQYHRHDSQPPSVGDPSERRPSPARRARPFRSGVASKWNGGLRAFKKTGQLARDAQTDSVHEPSTYGSHSHESHAYEATASAPHCTSPPRPISMPR
jgi:hypothetical protein